MQDTPERATPQPESQGLKIVKLLKAKKLPRMVDWFDPLLLAKVGVREIVSGTMGQYADQRLIQAATDRVTEEELEQRYDYRNEYAKQAQDGLWIDYISDLGDGFEATYAMAYLMAPETLDVKGIGKANGLRLPAGEILVMGGDQAYPQSSVQEYQNRFIDPYNWAFTTDAPRRKLFALPGNHDWYDGLGAFDGLFCSARDRISGGIGKQIGGWRCHQHRSYFAIRLPHDWWIWGADIQLAGVLDDSQRDYFDLVSRNVTEGHNVIICLAEPSWLHKNYDNLHEISMLARKHGGSVCAVLAGDWHHYSRYAAREKKNAPPELGVQFITCGGGGAFAHATHALDSKLKLQWPEVTAAPKRQSDAKDPLDFNRMERDVIKESDNVDFTLKSYDLRAETIYPSKALSRALSLKNLWLPLHNRRFAVFVGVVYFLFAWVFTVSISSHLLNSRLGDIAITEAKRAGAFASAARKQASVMRERERQLDRNSTTAPETLAAAKTETEAAHYAADTAWRVALAANERAKVLNPTRDMDKLDNEIAVIMSSADFRVEEVTQNALRLRDLQDMLQRAAPDSLGDASIPSETWDNLAGAFKGYAESVNGLDLPALQAATNTAKEQTNALAASAERAAVRAKAIAADAKSDAALAKTAAEFTEVAAKTSTSARAFFDNVDAWGQRLARMLESPINPPHQTVFERLAEQAGKVQRFGTTGAFSLFSPPEDMKKTDAEHVAAAGMANAKVAAYGDALRGRKLADANSAAKDAQAALESLTGKATVLADQLKGLVEKGGLSVDDTRRAGSSLVDVRENIRRAEALTKIVRPISYWEVTREIGALVLAEAVNPHQVFLAARMNPAFFFMLLGLLVGLIFYADVGTSTRRGLLMKIWIGTLHFMAHVAALLLVFAAIGQIATGIVYLLIIALAVVLLLVVAPILVVVAGPIVLLGYFFVLPYLQATFGNVLHNAWLAVKQVGEILLFPILFFFMPGVQEIVLFAAVSIFLGGLLGALIFGFYWAVMSAIFGRHTGDAFGALGIKDYKHFLRMRFDKDRVTIYPIAIDKVPGRWGWRVPKKGETMPGFNPQIVPKRSLGPRLIEDPIVIKAAGVVPKAVQRTA